MLAIRRMCSYFQYLSSYVLPLIELDSLDVLAENRLRFVIKVLLSLFPFFVQLLRAQVLNFIVEALVILLQVLVLVVPG